MLYKNVVNSQIMGLQNKNGSGLFCLETAMTVFKGHMTPTLAHENETEKR